MLKIRKITPAHESPDKAAVNDLQKPEPGQSCPLCGHYVPLEQPTPSMSSSFDWSKRQPVTVESQTRRKNKKSIDE